MSENETDIIVSLANSKDEREDIYRFRYQVYIQELGKDKLSSADHSKKWVHDKLDDTAHLFQAKKNDEIIATLRLNLGCDFTATPKLLEEYDLDKFIDKFGMESLSFTSRLMVANELRGTNVLGKILSYAYNFDLESGALFDFCHCQPTLIHIYQHLGYRRYTDNFEDIDVGYRIPLVLDLYDAEHLRKVRSPFFRILRRKKPKEIEKTAKWLQQSFPVYEETTRWLLDDDAYWIYMLQKLQPTINHDTPLLENLDLKERKDIIGAAPLLKARKGDNIIRSGDQGDEMYLLLDGVVEVFDHTKKKLLASFESGQVFGEIAFIAKISQDLNIHRTAYVVASTDCEILVLTPAIIQRLMKKSPLAASKLAFNIAGILGDRLLMMSTFEKES